MINANSSGHVLPGKAMGYNRVQANDRSQNMPKYEDETLMTEYKVKKCLSVCLNNVNY